MERPPSLDENRGPCPQASLVFFFLFFSAVITSCFIIIICLALFCFIYLGLFALLKKPSYFVSTNFKKERKRENEDDAVLWREVTGHVNVLIGRRALYGFYIDIYASFILFFLLLVLFLVRVVVS